MVMKLPSITSIISTTERVGRRFPLSVLAGVLGVIFGITLLHADEPSVYPNILLMLVLAFPLFTAITLFAEQRAWDTKRKSIVELLALIFLAVYYFLLPENVFFAEFKFITRYIMWMISFILLLTFILFLQRKRDGSILAFWHYNELLLFSAVLTIFWAGAIQIGLSIALGSIDVLFDINIDDERYAEIWIFLVGFFSTTFFLSRLPATTDEYYRRTDYPKELKLFSQYVLVPLVALYFLILYAYVVRILITQVWPEGILAYMILGFSFLGVLTYASLYPLRETFPWVKKVGTGFFIAVIPQVGMLFWALWFRIAPYGITENRYFVGIFGVWLLGIALFFLINKLKDIRIIPITFFIVTLIASFGPWGAFAISEKSQINRLENLLEKNNILVNNKIQKTDEEISFDDAKEISGALRYLIRTHGVSGIQPWFDADLSDYTKPREKSGGYNYEAPENIVTELIGIDYVEQWEGIRRDDEFFFINLDFQKTETPLTITGFDYLMLINNGTDDFTIDDVAYTFKRTGNILTLSRGSAMLATIDLTEGISDIIEKGQNRIFERDELTFAVDNDSVSLKLLIDSVNGEQEDDGIMITWYTGTLLLTLK